MALTGSAARATIVREIYCARGPEADHGAARCRSAHCEKKCEVWLWENALRELGFRRKSAGYWHCERRHGLPESAHLSVFPWAEHAPPSRAGRLFEVQAFHVTFRLEGEHVHFYYHEHGERSWAPGGYTSAGEIARIGHDPEDLCEVADGVAARLAAAMACAFLPRAET